MGKKNKKQEIDLEERLKQDYERWEHIKEFGCSDPFWEDGANMNIVRNHIIHHKREMEEKYGADHEKYPEIYYRELPPEAYQGYMSCAAEIRLLAAKALDIYLSDVNFRYLFVNREMLSKKEAEKISLFNVLGYASGLATALKRDDLVAMRRHAGRPESYQESFAICAQKMKEILYKKQEEIKENDQMPLFPFGLEPGQCR